MKDLNFFSSYSKKSNKKSFDKSVVLYSVIVLIIMVIIVYGIFNFMSIRNLNSEVAAINLELETSIKNPKIKEILDKEQEVKLIKEEMSKIKALDKYIKDKNVVSELLLEEISNNIPSPLFISSLSISLEGIRIEGKSKDKQSIAQFEHNIKDLERFDRVFIPQVTEQNGHYTFYMDIEFKEEKADGTEAAK